MAKNKISQEQIQMLRDRIIEAALNHSRVKNLRAYNQTDSATGRITTMLICGSDRERYMQLFDINLQVAADELLVLLASDETHDGKE